MERHQPCSIMRLPDEILIEILYRVFNTVEQRVFKKSLRLSNRTLTVLTTPILFKHVFIDADQFWPLEIEARSEATRQDERYGEYPQSSHASYNPPNCLQMDHRIQSCVVHLNRSWLDKSRLFEWASQHQAEFSHMFDRLVHLQRYGEWSDETGMTVGAIDETGMTVGAIDESHKLFLKTLY